MKLNVIVLLSVIAVIHGAAIESDVDVPISRKVVAPDSLFKNAWKFHNLLAALQLDIDEQLTAIRTAVSTVLKSSSNRTLAQIHSNALDILALDAPTRAEVFHRDLTATLCVTGLRGLLNGITEFTGFGSSNCVTSYDKSVEGALKTAYALLQKFEGNFGDVQQTVVRAFIGKNAFLQSEEIEARFASEYEKRLAEWDLIRPDVGDFVKTLDENVSVFNTVLGSCFKKIQDIVAPQYATILSDLAVCQVFDNTADPFAIFRQ